MRIRTNKTLNRLGGSFLPMHRFWYIACAMLVIETKKPKGCLQ